MRLASTDAAQPMAAHRIRGPLGALIASGMLLVSAVGPISAASAAKASPWSKAPTRAHGHNHLESARTAARLAVGNPRNTATKALPRRSVNIDHPPRLSTSSLPKVSGAVFPKPGIAAAPTLKVAQKFTGLATSESGGFQPPDPWVAVNNAYIVQVVNSMARISNRQGTEISSIPTWALFAMTADQFASDSRVIWDATHGRWVGIAISFNSNFSSNYLYLAVSDGADPGAAWTTYSFSYGVDLPDYPSVASSNDKIVLTDNLFFGNDAPNVADLVTVTWASLLGGAGLTANECRASGLAHPRAAQVLSSSNDVHLINMSTATGRQVYYRIRGTGRCDSVVEIVDGTDFGSAVTFAAPPAPRQSPGDTIDGALDERPTDAIWQNNHLWWVSTYPISYDAGATSNDAVAIWSATTAATGSPTFLSGQLINAGDGTDDFMGGIGLTRNGTLVILYSESSSSTYVSMMANQIPPGGVLGTPVHVDDGDATYAGERWGDYAGVAMDPVGTGSVWASHEVAAADGKWRTDVVRLVADYDFPSLPGVLTSSIVAPTGLGASVPVRVSWTASTDVRSNVARYQITQSIDGGPFTKLSNVTGTSTVRQLLINHTYQFAVQAIDAVGNAGSFRVGPPLRPYLHEQTAAVYTGTGWGTASSASYSGGSTRYNSTAGRYATFTATSARSIGIVTTKASSRGSFRVYVDGVLRATVSAYSTTTKYRQLVYQFSWSTPGTHKFRIYVLGTAGHPRVDIDAFVVLR